MSDEILKDVRAKADALGIKYHHRANAATIQKSIDAHLEATSAPVEEEEQVYEKPVKSVVTDLNNYTPQQKAWLSKKVVPLTAEEFQKKEAIEGRKKIGSLMRIRLQCMNPRKKDWPGEIISVGSAKLGTFKKFIPFNGEPYHVPKIIYDVLKEKKCPVFYNAIDDKGNKVRKSRLIDEFAIELLPPLTPQELKDLSRKQQMAAGTSPN